MQKKQQNKFWKIILFIFNITALILFLIEVIHPDTGTVLKKWYFILIAAFYLVQFTGMNMRRISDRKSVKDLCIVLLCFGIACYNFAVVEILGGVQYNLKDGKIWLLNALIVLIFVVIVYRIIPKIGIVMCISDAFFLILGLVNHYYYEFRGEPFEAMNLLGAGTALEVLSQYRFAVSRTMLFVLCTEAALFILIFAELKNAKVKLSVLPRCILEVIALWSGVYLVFNMSSLQFFDVSSTSRANGYLYSFAGFAKATFSSDEPEGYDEKKAVEILQAYENSDTEAAEETPDIIVIMNESFSDLPSIYGFETNEDVMPFIHSLSENTIKGNVLVSVYGGSTVNSEYEFLTGNSMAFFKRGSFPFVQYVRNNQQSIARLLDNNGYDVIGYHPYYPKGYERYRVYPYMGIEKFYSIEDELPSEEYLRWCMSDQSDYENLIYLYEESRRENDGAPVFVFNVTMQNHGGYGNDSEFEAEIMPVDTGKQFTAVNEYLTLIRKSDQAFEQLIRYFSEVDRDVIILMFGDHQPGFEKEIYQTIAEELYEDNVSAAIKQKQYYTNFIMWANFDIEEQKDMLISANYLRPLLLQTANCKMSSYDCFLSELMKEYPAINASGYFDGEGKWHSLSQLGEKLKQYSYVQYYNAFNQSRAEARYFK